ncbi:phage tail protein [Salinibacterium sp. M195]|uniref:phage tail protein n=1 Tax=Salinibacterium sp. M195 TaxID=2583374 RepID=UPI001C636C8B|nr:phage tail protein [Salinibacterium sp. M195]QYH35115.1 hypothetical protein FFT87_03640 [Salinibacterium sp. M195]
MPSPLRAPSRSLRLFAGAAVAAVLLAGCTAQGSSADALQKACIDASSSAIKLIAAADPCGAGFVEAVFVTEAAADGVAGADGVNGTDGINGADGLAGANGVDGADGAAGAAGKTGPTGADGATGETGHAGVPGAVGLTGATGPMGIDGMTGMMGPMGANGALGAPGSMGAPGSDGQTGAQGPQGATGETGATGATGATGPAGNSLLAAHFGTDVGGASNGSRSTCIVGTLSLTASSLAGDGMVADGRSLPVSGNETLFLMISNVYGGDGINNFKIPNMSAVTPNGMTWNLCVTGILPNFP